MDIAMSEASEEDAARRHGEVSDGTRKKNGCGNVGAELSATPPRLQDARLTSEIWKALRDLQVDMKNQVIGELR